MNTVMFHLYKIDILILVWEFRLDWEFRPDTPLPMAAEELIYDR